MRSPQVCELKLVYFGMRPDWHGVSNLSCINCSVGGGVSGWCPLKREPGKSSASGLGLLSRKTKQNSERWSILFCFILYYSIKRLQGTEGKGPADFKKSCLRFGSVFMNFFSYLGLLRNE